MSWSETSFAPSLERVIFTPITRLVYMFVEVLVVEIN